MQAGTRVHEVLPSCVLAGEERREVKRVLKVDAPVFRHSLHLASIHDGEVLPLDKGIDKQVPQAKDLDSVATDFK